ncbi:hypothetical protein [Spiroplasma taiwanense]|uniref:Uncharacterized protein n=1 Tax=Spiroplasma taiwanense CT-1 TaxID=1276220 RepID=S5MGX6_9MOLU|nr:hypothetical protein [Spiroplasma taiwanense]AGR41100.1 hypothetical protein STAIW_v1c04540 [Spiroplasma taiwanense CT-1]
MSKFEKLKKVILDMWDEDELKEYEELCQDIENEVVFSYEENERHTQLEEKYSILSILKSEIKSIENKLEMEI